MKTSKTISKALERLRQAGYHRVSLHELAWHTSLNKDDVLDSLRNTGYALTTHDDETYIKIGN